jgi:hypothetical protein
MAQTEERLPSKVEALRLNPVPPKKKKKFKKNQKDRHQIL